MRYDKPMRGDEPKPRAAMNEEMHDSPELLALAEQLRDEARGLAETYPARRDVVREFPYTRRRSSLRSAIALAASLAAIGLTLWGTTAWLQSPDRHGRVADRGPTVAVADASPAAISPPAAVTTGVMLLPVSSFEGVEELTIPEREAVFDLLEGGASEVSYLSI